jgi:hypothetical protein
VPGEQRQFEATLRDGKTGGFEIDLPFDADQAWGVKARHHVAGLVSGVMVRGQLSLADGTYSLKLGPAWRRDATFKPAAAVEVTLWPEGPQADALPEDLQAVLQADPQAFAFWQGLATFYRTSYLKWLDGASRRPALREERLRELVKLLRAGKKQRER